MLKLPLATRTCTTASLLVHVKTKNSHLSSLLSIFPASNLLSLNNDENAKSLEGYGG